MNMLRLSTIVIAMVFTGESALAQTLVVRVDSENGVAAPAGQGNGWNSNAFK